MSFNYKQSVDIKFLNKKPVFFKTSFLFNKIKKNDKHQPDCQQTGLSQRAHNRLAPVTPNLLIPRT